MCSDWSGRRAADVWSCSGNSLAVALVASEGAGLACGTDAGAERCVAETLAETFTPLDRCRLATTMFAAKKIVKEKDAQPDAFEMDVAQALCDLEANSNDLKAELRELYIVSAKELDVNGRKAVVIFVPFKLLKVVHKIQSRLVREVCKSPCSGPARREV